MPYTLVSTQIRLENGPCVVGDERSDPELMEFLEAKLTEQLGNNFKEWVSALVPREVLNKLEVKGYNVVSVTGIGQTCIWTCYKPQQKAVEQ